MTTADIIILIVVVLILLVVIYFYFIRPHRKGTNGECAACASNSHQKRILRTIRRQRKKEAKAKAKEEATLQKEE